MKKLEVLFISLVAVLLIGNWSGLFARLLILRGPDASLPSELANGEPAVTTDTGRFFVGISTASQKTKIEYLQRLRFLGYTSQAAQAMLNKLDVSRFTRFSSAHAIDGGVSGDYLPRDGSLPMTGPIRGSQGASFSNISANSVIIPQKTAPSAVELLEGLAYGGLYTATLATGDLSADVTYEFLNDGIYKDGSPIGGAISFANITGQPTDNANLSSALAAKESTSNKGAVNGYAPLDSSGKVPIANLPVSSMVASSWQTSILNSVQQNLSSSRFYDVQAWQTHNMPRTAASQRIEVFANTTSAVLKGYSSNTLFRDVAAGTTSTGGYSVRVPKGSIYTFISTTAGEVWIAIKEAGSALTDYILEFLAVLGLDPDSHNFGEVTVNTESTHQTHTLSNSGNTSAQGITFTPYSSVFRVMSSNCGSSLSAGTNCTFKTAFTPTAARAFNGHVQISATGLSDAILTLTGTGISGESAAMYDTFTDSDGTLLQNHVPNYPSGQTWTRGANTNVDITNTQIYYDKITSTDATAGTIYYSSFIPTTADYSVNADIVVASNADISMAIMVRATANTNFIGYYTRWTSGSWILYRINDGSVTTLGTYTGDAPTTTKNVELIVSSSDLTVKIDGTTRITYSDATPITATGRPAVYNRFATTGSTMDNFEVN